MFVMDGSVWRVDGRIEILKDLPFQVVQIEVVGVSFQVSVRRRQLVKVLLCILHVCGHRLFRLLFANIVGLSGLARRGAKK